MNLLSKGQFVFLLSLCCGGWFSCTLDDPGSSTDTAALSLSYTQQQSLTTLQWSKVNVTGFKEYVILQSLLPIPDNSEPVVDGNVTVLKRIDDYEITSLFISPELLASQVCYKLYCSVDDRFLYSDNICIDQQYTLIPGFYDRACHLDGLDDAAMFDRFNRILTTCDYKTGEIIASTSDASINFPSMEMITLGDNDYVLTTEQSQSWLRKYNHPSLENPQFKSFSDVLWATNAHGAFIFAGTSEFNKNFQVIHASNLSTITTRPGLQSTQTIATFGTDPITVLTIGNASSKKYVVNTSGQITSEENIPARIVDADIQHTCGQGESIFICGFAGQIVSEAGTNIGQLSSEPNTFITLVRIRAGDTHAAAIRNINGLLDLAIYDLSGLPNVTLKQTFTLPSSNIGDIIFEGETIYVIGTSFSSSQPQTFILQYPFKP